MGIVGGGVRGLIIRPDHSVARTVLRTLEDYKSALEGAYLEHLRLINGSMYVDEEAPLKPYDPNRINYVASAIVSTVGSVVMTGWVFGPVIVTGPPDMSGWDTHVTPELGVLVYDFGRLFAALEPETQEAQDRELAQRGCSFRRVFVGGPATDEPH